jgi:O-antigen ligase
MPIKHFLVNGLGYTILATMLVLPCLLGAYSAYLSMIAVLIGVIVAFDLRGISSLLDQIWTRMWLAAFVLIAIAFCMTAQSPKDALYALDFIQIPLAIVAGLVFSKAIYVRGIQTIALFSFTGALVALMVALYGTQVLHLPRPSGLELSTIHFAYFAVMLGFLSLAGFFVENHKTSNFYLLGPPIGILTAAMAGSRGSLIVALTSIVILLAFFLTYSGSKQHQKWLSILASSIVIVALGSLSIYFGFSRAFNLSGVAAALSGEHTADASANLRLEHFSAGAEAFMRAPWFGYGWVHQVSSALPYMSDFAQETFVHENWAYLHNELLSLAVSAGVFGIAAYLLIFSAPLVGALARPRDGHSVAVSYCVLIITCGVFAGGVTDVLFKYEIPKTFFFFILTFLLSFPVQEIQRDRDLSP